MQTPLKRRKRNSAWARFIGPIILSVLLFLLIVFTVLLVLGNLKIIPWPGNLNTVLLSIIIPDLSVIIALAQWLHSMSSDKKEEQSKLQEQNVTQPVSATPVALLNLPNSP